MNHSSIPAIALAALLVGIGGCGDDDNTPSESATSFSANLSGEEEVPAVATDATGTATFSITGSEITYTVTVNGLANPVFSHIHIAPPGANGPVRLNLCGTGSPVPDCTPGDGVLVSSTNGVVVGDDPPITFDDLVAAMRAGNAYVNVHTDDGVGQSNTGAGDMISGEIRGQIVAE
jgi:CHRD domain-containing protein